MSGRLPPVSSGVIHIWLFQSHIIIIILDVQKFRLKTRDYIALVFNFLGGKQGCFDSYFLQLHISEIIPYTQVTFYPVEILLFMVLSVHYPDLDGADNRHIAGTNTDTSQK
jgi:hypothetical protein